MKIMTGLFDASIFMDLHRLPELFCGFIRRPDEGPTLYPVACLPQAWASAAVFCLLQAALGISFDIKAPQLRFYHPVLPPFLEEVQIRNLNVPGGRVDLDLQRHANNVSINVKDKDGDIEIAVIH
jgi:glycogen debranching enzyme